MSIIAVVMLLVGMHIGGRDAAVAARSDHRVHRAPEANSASQVQEISSEVTSPKTQLLTIDLGGSALAVARRRGGNEVDIEGELVGYIVSDRDDFQVIPLDMIVKATRLDDGIDISAYLTFRNRGKTSVMVKALSLTWAVEGLDEMVSKSAGYSSTLVKERSEVVRMTPVRLFSDKSRRIFGEILIKFGSDTTFGCAMEAHFILEAENFPDKKGQEGLVGRVEPSSVRYWINQL